MADNTTQVWRFLRGKGLSPAQAAGVIGSMQGESGPGLNPAAVNPNGGATGIAQWLGGRKNAAVMTKRLGPQLNHLWGELQGPEHAALQALKGTHTPEQAAIAWQRVFERGAPFEQKYNLRATNARKVFNRLSGVAGDVSAASGGGGGVSGGGGSTRTTTTTTPGVDNRAARAALISSFLEDRNSDPVNFAVQANALKDIAPTSTSRTVRTPGQASSAQPSAASFGAGRGTAGRRGPVAHLTSEGGTHPTLGLAGYPAHDYFAKAGSAAVAPITGRVVRLSGHDPAQGPTQGPHGPLGYSVYIQGDDGHEYFLTHMGSRQVKVGQQVRAGQRIGTVANYDKYGTPSHIHMGVK